MARKILAGSPAADEAILRARTWVSAGGAGSRARSMATMAAMALALAVPFPAVGWEPTKPVEFVVPAGTGGGADQMARLLGGNARSKSEGECGDGQQRQRPQMAGQQGREQ